MRGLWRTVLREGMGVHTGVRCAVRLRPVPWGTGLVVRAGAHQAQVHVRSASAPGGCTVLAVGPHTVATPEHVLAAVIGLGVTDLAIEVEGPEVPILDGSALPWVEALREAGIREGSGGAVRVVTEEVHVRAAGGEAWIRPSDRLRVSVEVAWPGLVGTAHTALGDDFVTEVAPARTFVFAEDIPRLLALGRGLGATRENTVVWGQSRELRFSDEPVRHKLLDAVGDLALAGCPIRGHLHVLRGSHSLHHAVIRAWLESL